MRRHSPTHGICARCGVTIIRTTVAGDIYVRDGRVIRDPVSCRWGEPCVVAMPAHEGGDRG